jgi:hypothetical protein
MTIARQRLAIHVPERCAVKNRRPLLDNGFSYHGIRHVPVTTRTTTTVLESFEAVISTLFAQGYKRKPEETKWHNVLEAERERKPVIERERMSQSQELIHWPGTVDGKMLVVQEETERALGSHRF